VLASLKVLGQYVHAKITGRPPFVGPAIVIPSTAKAGLGRHLLDRLRGNAPPQPSSSGAADTSGAEPLPAVDSETS
jgi:hypothetical protein